VLQKPFSIIPPNHYYIEDKQRICLPPTAKSVDALNKWDFTLFNPTDEINKNRIAYLSQPTFLLASSIIGRD